MLVLIGLNSKLCVLDTSRPGEPNSQLSDGSRVLHSAYIKLVPSAKSLGLRRQPDSVHHRLIMPINEPLI